MKKYWVSNVEVIALRSKTVHCVREQDTAQDIFDKMEGKQIFNVKDLTKSCNLVFSTLACEAVAVIMLNTNNEIIGFARLEIGISNQCTVYPRKVFQAALLAGASSIALVHNHPGGNISPSHADWEITDRIKTAGKILEIPLLDHIIYINENRSISMREMPQWDD